jgi:hypothetical protein
MTRRFEVLRSGESAWLIRQIGGGLPLQLQMRNMTDTEVERVAALVESAFEAGRQDAQRDIRRALGLTQ